MGYYVNVGHFNENKSGLGSRGWRIWRRGNSVHLMWGAVRVHHLKRKVVIEWTELRPQVRTHRFRSASLAEKFRLLRIKTKTSGRNGNKGYSKLSKGGKIRHYGAE